MSYTVKSGFVSYFRNGKICCVNEIYGTAHTVVYKVVVETVSGGFYHNAVYVVWVLAKDISYICI